MKKLVEPIILAYFVAGMIVSWSWEMLLKLFLGKETSWEEYERLTGGKHDL